MGPTDAPEPTRTQRVLDVLSEGWTEKVHPKKWLFVGTQALASILLATGTQWLYAFLTGSALQCTLVLGVLFDRWAENRAQLRALAIQEEVADEIAAEYNLITDFFAEIVRDVGAAMRLEGSDALTRFSVALQKLVEALCTINPRRPRTVRATLYELVSLPNGRTELRAQFTARSGHMYAPAEYRQDTQTGSALLQLIDSGRQLFIEDSTRESDEWSELPDDCQTFLFSPISSISDPLGLLSMEASRTDDIVEDDHYKARLASDLAALIFQEMRDRELDP